MESPTETCVPFQRAVTGWSYQRISGRVGGTNFECTVTVESLTDDFYVVYKDVHVIPVPRALGGGYLLLLGRYRIRQSDVHAAQAADPTLPSQPEDAANALSLPGSSLSDIVAFWCADADFAEDVTGPFLLVSSLGALADEYQDSAGGAPHTGFRPWVGVPGGTFVGTTLYVYYSCIPNISLLTGAVYVDSPNAIVDCVRAYDGSAGWQDVPTAAAADVYASRTVVASYTGAYLQSLLTGKPRPEWQWENILDELDPLPGMGI